MLYSNLRKRFEWSADKNVQLLRERGIGFEEIAACIATNGLIEILEHPNQQRYPRQRIFVVWRQHYAYLVPYAENDEAVFLKTIIPSRRMTKQVLQEGRGNEEDESVE